MSLIWSLPELRCPACDYKFTAAGSMNSREEFGPSPGDTSICAKCLAFLSYVAATEDELGLELLSDEAYDELPEAAQAGLLQAEALVCRHQERARWANEYRDLLRRAAGRGIAFVSRATVRLKPWANPAEVTVVLTEENFTGTRELEHKSE